MHVIEREHDPATAAAAAPAGGLDARNNNTNNFIEHDVGLEDQSNRTKVPTTAEYRQGRLKK